MILISRLKKKKYPNFLSGVIVFVNNIFFELGTYSKIPNAVNNYCYLTVYKL